MVLLWSTFANMVLLWTLRKHGAPLEHFALRIHAATTFRAKPVQQLNPVLEQNYE
jgi:hypothetical protein